MAIRATCCYRWSMGSCASAAAGTAWAGGWHQETLSGDSLVTGTGGRAQKRLGQRAEAQTGGTGAWAHAAATRIGKGRSVQRWRCLGSPSRAKSLPPHSLNPTTCSGGRMHVGPGRDTTVQLRERFACVGLERSLAAASSSMWAGAGSVGHRPREPSMKAVGQTPSFLWHAGSAAQNTDRTGGAR